MSDNQYNIQIGTDADSSSVEELAAKIQEATGNADELGASLGNVGADAGGAAGEISSIGTAAGTASTGVSSISADPVKEVAKAGNEAKGGLEGGASAADMMTGALSAIVGLGIATVMYDLADAAGAYEESWDRIALLTTGSTGNMGAVEEKWNPAIASMKEATGRGAGVIRGHIQSMSIAGVTDTNAITSAFEGLAGKSYATGLDLGTMETALQRTIQTGMLSGRTLMSLGVSQEEVFKATGMSMEELSRNFKGMTADQRAQVMSQILNNDMAKESNEAYQESWAYVKDQAGLAWDYLKRVVGEVVLPILIPAITFFTNVLKILGDWFSKLDGPTKFWIGALIVLGGVIAIGAAAILSFVAILNLLNITTMVARMALFAITAAQWLLNIAMSANPIMIIVIAIIALIAVLVYLYYNNETVRNGINWLLNGLKALGGYILTGLIAAWNALTGFITGIGPALATLIVGVVMFGIRFHARVIGIFIGVVNKARAYISQLPGIVWNEMMNIGRKIAGAAGYIFSQVQAVFGNIVKWAMQALGIASPGYMARAVVGEMNRVVMGISDAQSYAGSAAQGLGAAILDGFGSPSLSVGTSINPSTASLGFDATEINASLNKNSDDNTFKKIVQNNIINQEGIMGPKQAAEYIVKAVMEQLEEENLITGKTG